MPVLQSGVRPFFPNFNSKGQKKLKWFFQVDVSSKKTNEPILLYYYETWGQLVFIRFLEEIEVTKKDISKLSDLYHPGIYFSFYI